VNLLYPVEDGIGLSIKWAETWPRRRVESTSLRIRRGRRVPLKLRDASQRGEPMANSRTSALIFAALVFAASSAHAENILPNPHFDSDLSGWTETNADAVSWSGDGATAPGSVQIQSNDAVGARSTRACP
jgi:hypothetical protein